ncbi:MAG: tryptophan synthase subunit beta [Alphaproteobacteria bacterium]
MTGKTPPEAPKKPAPRGTAEMVQSDYEMIRVIDDIVQTLVNKGVLNWTDLPAAAVEKLRNRSTLREKESTLSNLVGDNNESIL